VILLQAGAASTQVLVHKISVAEKNQEKQARQLQRRKAATNRNWLSIRCYDNRNHKTVTKGQSP